MPWWGIVLLALGSFYMGATLMAILAMAKDKGDG